MGGRFIVFLGVYIGITAYLTIAVWAGFLLIAALGLLALSILFAPAPRR